MKNSHPAVNTATRFFPILLILCLAGQTYNMLQMDPPESEQIVDCCCTTGTVELANNDGLYDVLSQIQDTTFFKIFKVDFSGECQFWNSDGLCSKPGCQVCPCDDDEIPETWRQEDKHRLAHTAVTPCTCPFDAPTGGGAVDTTIDATQFNTWEVDDKMWVAYPEGGNSTYINLQLNPEGYTGYTGWQPQRVWSSIYGGNCFDAGDDQLQKMCFEERVFYRLISGIHSGVSAHIALNYPLTESHWGPSLSEFKNRLGDHPDRIDNMYFVFVFLLRAVSKMQDALLGFDFDTGNPVEDQHTNELVQQLMNGPMMQNCPAHASFDESAMFDGNPLHPRLNQFKDNFRNVSLILDCIECEKCKLYSKLQVLGVGTALKVLFEPEPISKEFLQRNEVIAIVNTLAKFSKNLHTVEMFREWDRSQREIQTATGVFVGASLLVLLYWLFYRRLKGGNHNSVSNGEELHNSVSNGEELQENHERTPKPNRKKKKKKKKHAE